MSRGTYTPPRKLLTPPYEPPPLKPAPPTVRPHDQADRVWLHVLDQLREVGVSESAMATWLEPLTPIGALDGTLCVKGPQRARLWVARRFGRLIGELLRDEETFTGLRLYDAQPDDEPEVL